VAVVSTWFTRRRAGAIGIVASGSSIGAVILPIVLAQLIPRIGFGWAVRVVALIQGCTLLVAILTLQSRLPPRKSGPWVEPKAFLQKSYTLFIVGSFLAFWGIYTPFFYATAYLESVGAPKNVTDYILAIMNVSSPTVQA
jgi:MFS family permease